MVELVLVLISTTSPDSFSPSASADYLLKNVLVFVCSTCLGVGDRWFTLNRWIRLALCDAQPRKSFYPPLVI